MRTPRLAALELRRFGRGRLPRAALAALLLLPLLYGALYLWSFWDPYGRLDKVPVALVDADRGASADGRRIDAGAELVQQLRANRSRGFDWQTTDAAHAASGVENGRYYLSLTIPADFSRRIASGAGNTPQAGVLQVRTNDADNYIVGQISRTVFAEIRAAASAKASRSYYDRIFVAFADLHDRTQQAADGAGRLNAGIGTAARGAGRLARGLSAARAGSTDLASGLDRLDSGLGTLQGGAGQLASGARSAADGTQRLADQVDAAAAQVRPFLRQHSQDIATAARLVADTSQTIRDNLGKLPQSAAQADRDAQAAYRKLDGTYRTRCGEAVRTDPDCPALKQAADAARSVAAIAARLDAAVQHSSPALDRLGGELGTVHSLAAQLAAEAPHLTSDLDTAVGKINALNDGAHRVADGARSLAGGLASAEDGADRLGGGAHRLDSGIGELESGARTLDGGLYQLSTGSSALATGLRDGVGQIPDLSAAARGAHSAMMADPVRLAAQDMHQAPNYGTGFAPYFIPLSLWVGAMVAYMLMQPLSRRALSAGAPVWRITLAGWLPVVAIGVLQTAALLSVLHWAIGLRMARAAGTAGFLLVVVACFTAIVQWLGARFGPAGRLLVLALLMLQLTSAGGTYPVQTSPGFFNWIHPLLPMSYIVEGLRRLITGGGLGPVWQACLVLLGFTVVSLALTAWTARRRQVWTVDRLHPELSL